MSRHIFISYAREDGSGFVKKLANMLDRDGFLASYDRSPFAGLEPGKAWWQELEEKIRTSWRVLFVVTEGSLRSKTCRRELEVAFAAGKTVIPLKLTEMEQPKELSDIQGIDFTGEWRPGLAELRSHLDDLRRRQDENADGLTPARSTEDPSRGSAPGGRGIVGLAPTEPELFVGRDETLAELRRRLGIDGEGHRPADPITAIYAYPGMGKTATAAKLAYDSEIATAFPDGVLWADLGPEPDLVQELGNWGGPLGDETIRHHGRGDEDRAARQLRGLLARHPKALLIVDDVWEQAHGQLFIEARGDCPIVLTTRFEEDARAFCRTFREGRFRLRELDAVHSLDLLARLAPEVVGAHPEACRQLVVDLEGLPLALLVAGSLLEEEHEIDRAGVADLLEELRSGAALLEQKAPADRSEFESETAHVPTVGALLRRSVDTLSPEMREKFALLGAFREKPATFDRGDVAAQWDIADPKANGLSLRTLKRRGLLESTGDGRYQMHALLHSLASSMYDEILERNPTAAGEPPDIDFGDEDE